SYSGNTEETLNAFRQARGREAQAVCITSGGQLLEEATKADLPHLKIPGGRPPRAALAFSLAPLLRLSNALGLVPIEPAHVDETIGILSALTAQYQTGTAHLAFDIARRLAGQLPVVYTAPDLLETVGVRWRGQMQENGKSPAYGNVFPELNHNEIVGWEHGLMEQMTVVVLRDQNDHPRVLRRIDVTRGLVSERAADWIEVESMGESRMARLLSMICLGDWVSLYLALHNGADPTPIPLIDALKDTLSRS
ncbi:MAG: bifunctional phosphoglucose/phosphomannose isomerase, partial [Bacteroidota bacterium]